MTSARVMLTDRACPHRPITFFGHWSSLCQYRTDRKGKRIMDASTLRPGMCVGGRTVRQAIDTFTTRWVRRNGRSVAAGTQRVRRVTFADGTTVDYSHGTPVNATGYADKLPAGPVASKLANNATRIRASDSRWAGESGRLGELRTRELDLISRTNMYDAGRVNGTVGAARNGAGPVALTGPSFP